MEKCEDHFCLYPSYSSAGGWKLLLLPTGITCGAFKTIDGSVPLEVLM